MSEKINDGGPAFPQAETFNGNTVGDEHGQGGMSLRDWFAGQALAGVKITGLDFGTNANPVDPWPWVAEQCYKAADAMLRAREAT